MLGSREGVTRERGGERKGKEKTKREVSFVGGKRKEERRKKGLHSLLLSSTGSVRERFPGLSEFVEVDVDL